MDLTENSSRTAIRVSASDVVFRDFERSLADLFTVLTRKVSLYI